MRLIHLGFFCSVSALLTKINLYYLTILFIVFVVPSEKVCMVSTRPFVSCWHAVPSGRKYFVRMIALSEVCNLCIPVTEDVADGSLNPPFALAERTLYIALLTTLFSVI